jgi:hypothetical protein
MGAEIVEECCGDLRNRVSRLEPNSTDSEARFI